MVGGVVGGMFGGPLGAQLGSQIGGGIGGMLEGLISNHGQSNVQSAMNNNMIGSLAGRLGQAIQCAPGIPQFARDEMCQALDSARQNCPAEPTPPGCQQETDDAMSGLIDKIVDKVVDQIMNKLQGGECESGGFEDMLRQAIEDVVREKIDGGCDGNGDTATAEPESGGGSSCTRTEANDSQSLDDADMNACEATNKLDEKKQEGKEGKGGCANWLVELAKALADIQTDFLNKAMDNLETMKNNKGAMDTEQSGEGQGGNGTAETGNAGEDDKDTKKASRGEFMAAQSEFQANFQMFNMMANMTATSLKSLGEGLTSIARKQ